MDKRKLVVYQQIVIGCFYVNSIMLGLVFYIVIPCFFSYFNRDNIRNPYIFPDYQYYI